MDQQEVAEYYKQELKNCQFDIEQMGNFVWGSKENCQNIKQGFHEFNQIQELQYDPEFFSMSRKEQMKHHLQQFVKYQQYGNQKYNFNEQFPQQVAAYSFYQPMPTIVHQAIYMASDKQKEQWLEPIISLEWIGCYCQTELRHGSDIQHIETQAIYQPEKQVFFINTPNLGATKFWVGELGVLATHAIVYAQLIINKKKFGVHPFLVQIRDLETHLPLTGIKVGDIGSKIAFNTKDNGFIQFNNVQIPRGNMLSKFQKVTKQGEYKEKSGKNKKLTYAIMMHVRLFISCYSQYQLAQALTIAIRYSAFRKQFKDLQGLEKPIIEYQQQQEKLFVPLAELYAITASSFYTINLYHQMMKNIQENNDYSLSSYMHIILSGCKAVYSENICQHLDMCRQACGGHGYHHFSGLPVLIEEYKQNVTVEGENTVMLLQLAKYLLKQILTSKAKDVKQLDKKFEYFNNSQKLLSQKILFDEKQLQSDFTLLKELHRMNSLYIIQHTGNQFLKILQKTSKAEKQIIDQEIGTLLVESAKSYIDYYTVKNFCDFITQKMNKEIGEANYEALNHLYLLFSIEKLINRPWGVIESGILDPSLLCHLENTKFQMLEKIRVNMIGLVDCFNFGDGQLKSVLARKDGKVYENMLELSKKSQLNQHSDELREEVLKMKSKL